VLFLKGIDLIIANTYDTPGNLHAPQYVNLYHLDLFPQSAGAGFQTLNQGI
jgi:hypothetical protein